MMFQRKRAMRCAAVLAAACSIPFATMSRAVTNPDAVAYQNDASHDGASTFSNFAGTPSKLWSVNLGASISYPLVAQGEVYVTAADNFSTGENLYALNQSTGNTDWHVTVSNDKFDSAAYDSGRIFVFSNANSSSGLMTAYNAATGAILWSAPLSNQYAFSSPPTASNGIIYTAGAGEGGTLYALRETDGKSLWTAPVENGDNSSPVVTATGVYVSYAGPQIYDFNASSGASTWHYNSGIEGGGGKTPVLYNGYLYARDDDSFYVFNASTGSRITSFNSSLPGDTAPAFSNGIGFVPNGSSLDAFNASTGSIIWTKTLSNDTFESAPIVINNMVFEGTRLGELYEYNGSTGALASETNVGTAINAPDEQNVSQPLTGLGAGDGILAVPAGDTLVAYNLTAVPEPTAMVLLGILGPAILRRKVRRGI